MNRATPQLRDFAKRLMTYQTLQSKSTQSKGTAALQVFEKLHPQLATLMGNGGVLALFSRALMQAGAEIHWLRLVRVRTDGTLEGGEEVQKRLESDEFFEGGVVLLAQLLALLVAFIGENLTFGLVREIWPKVRLNGLDLGSGEKNEKAG